MLTDFARNRIIDWWRRGQTFAPPATAYLALLSAASRSAHTEVTTGGVARAAYAQSLANWSGTQGAGTTSASSGTTGLITPNNEIEFAASASALVTASFIGFFDAASAGNLLDFYPIVDGAGSPISRNWAIGERVFIDNAAPTLSQIWG